MHSRAYIEEWIDQVRRVLYVIKPDVTCSCGGQKGLERFFFMYLRILHIYNLGRKTRKQDNENGFFSRFKTSFGKRCSTAN